jgi:hypothetical protein
MFTFSHPDAAKLVLNPAPSAASADLALQGAWAGR